MCSPVPPLSQASGFSCTAYPPSLTSSTVCSPPAWPTTPSSAPQSSSSASTLPPAKLAASTWPHISTRQVVTSSTTMPQLSASFALLPIPMSTWHSSARNTRPDGAILGLCGRSSSSTFSARWRCIGTLGFRGSKKFKKRHRLICRERRRWRRGSQKWQQITKSRRNYGSEWIEAYILGIPTSTTPTNGIIWGGHSKERSSVSGVDLYARSAQALHAKSSLDNGAK